MNKGMEEGTGKGINKRFNEVRQDLPLCIKSSGVETGELIRRLMLYSRAREHGEVRT